MTAPQIIKVSAVATRPQRAAILSSALLRVPRCRLRSWLHIPATIACDTIGCRFLWDVWNPSENRITWNGLLNDKILPLWWYPLLAECGIPSCGFRELSRLKAAEYRQLRKWARCPEQEETAPTSRCPLAQWKV